MDFLKKTNFDFIGNRKIAYIISIVLVIIGIVSLIFRGGINFGIDFIGGTLIQIKMEPAPEINEVRNILVDNGLRTAQIQRFPQSNEIIIKVKKGEIESREEVHSESPAYPVGETMVQVAASGTEKQTPRMGKVEERFYNMFLNAFPQVKMEIMRVEMVGPSVGKKLLRQAIWALFWGLMGIMVYVGWRFEFKYSAPAVLSLLHDVFIVISVFALLNKEIDMTVIAAFLTIAGYSINDTIVIYDRIREKVRLFAKDELGKVMNIAINETLGRTVITGTSTIIVLVCLLVLGGEVIHNFAFALLIGTILGTYSSIFVASPLVYEWELRHGRK